MKKLFFTLVFALLAIISEAQTLEHTYNGNAFWVKLSETEIVYQVFDIPSKTLRIYDINHNLIKTIVVNTSDEIYGVANLSRTLFNLDSQFEFTAYSSSAPYSVKIYDENGNSFFTKNTVGTAVPIVRNTNSGTKMIISEFTITGAVTTYTTYVYSLIGTAQALKPIEDSNAQLAYPNPTGEYLIIPTKTNETIEIIDIQGNFVKSFISDGTNNLNISNLTPGVYLDQTQKLWSE